MTDIERIEQRLAAVERTVVDGDFELDELADVAALAEDVERIESRLEELERRVADLEGSAQAVEGYVSNIEAVNDDVERRADAAIAAVDRLERRVDELDAETRAAAGSDGATGPAEHGVGDDAAVGAAVDAPRSGDPHPAADDPAGSNGGLFEDPHEVERTVDDVIGSDDADRRPGGSNGTTDRIESGNSQSKGRAADSESVASADQESVERSLSDAAGGPDESSDTGDQQSDAVADADDDSGGLLASLRSTFS
ncbi:hypothetical protein BV210_05300 [Halorientalis sp. IM1011]|uniref:DUF7310 family coiled-coil domain-containing protein n=1 Tax=Halorientalis sp. IM1011 TaxID=1932360 RepID=UPI00097CD72E|nr:hypothetical protein [Halorientalis sp. IM1011]AQL42162.1 hypothetical protein BV210_05300 [Halorientalis sp. IM1011]